jgi:uncharacterized protein YyaL (SSP411 family)
LAVELLLSLGDYFAVKEYTDKATHMLETVAEPMARYPTAFGHALGAADMLVRGAVEVALAGPVSDERFSALSRAVAERYVPSLLLAGGEADGIAVLEGRAREEPTAFVCHAYTCAAPTSDPVELREQLS